MALSDEKWIKAIPASQSHGSGILQKKLWRLVSDYTRIRDSHKYGRCVVTGQRISNWKDADAGHYISYSICNGMFKFDERNVHLQTKRSNTLMGASDGVRFAGNLWERGIDVDELEQENNKLHGTNIRDWMVVEKMEDMLKKMSELPEKPEYFDRAWTLYTEGC